MLQRCLDLTDHLSPNTTESLCHTLSGVYMCVLVECAACYHCVPLRDCAGSELSFCLQADLGLRQALSLNLSDTGLNTEVLERPLNNR